VIALCDDGFTFLWLYTSIVVRPHLWPSTQVHVRKYFIEPIEDEL
jgi:hypothetical protein